MRYAVIALHLMFAALLPSCISFPRAEHHARMRQHEEARSDGRFTADPAPRVGTRKEFKDRYFRAQ